VTCAEPELPVEHLRSRQENRRLDEPQPFCSGEALARRRRRRNACKPTSSCSGCRTIRCLSVQTHDAVQSSFRAGLRAHHRDGSVSDRLESLYRNANQTTQTGQSSFTLTWKEYQKTSILDGDVFLKNETIARRGLGTKPRKGVCLQAYAPDSHGVMQDPQSSGRENGSPKGGSPLTIPARQRS